MRLDFQVIPIPEDVRIPFRGLAGLVGAIRQQMLRDMTVEIMDAAPPGSIGGTYAGNPLACAAALAVRPRPSRK